MTIIRTLAVSALFTLWIADSNGQTVPTAVLRQDICVTEGSLTYLPDGQIQIDAPSVRAVANASDGRTAEIQFRYLGPSDKTRPLASGELRRQIGLKLHTLDTCNLVYAMWHIEPNANIVVLIKHNPTEHTNNECHAGGYTTIQPSASLPMPDIAIGEWHIFRATLAGATLTVTADGVDAWQGVLPASIGDFDGPSGFRTDNARFVFAFLAGAAPPRPDFRCPRGAGD